MLRKLYGMADVPGRSDSAGDAAFAKSKFEEIIKGRREIQNNYCWHVIFTFFLKLCCCFQGYAMRKECCRRRIKNYRKFHVALSRLREEQDI